MKDRNRKMLFLLGLVVVSMTFFGFANTELYNMFCKAIGIDLNPNNTELVVDSDKIDETHEVKMVFTVQTMRDVPVKFTVKERTFPINLGKMYANEYTFQNLTTDTLFFRPVHSVYPAAAANQYTMMKCFCFDDMILMPLETLTLPMTFRFSTDVNREVNRIVMHYTLVKRNPDDVLNEEGTN